MNGEMMKQFENLFIELKKTTLNEMKMIDSTNEKGDEVDLSQEDRQRALDLKLLGRQNFMLKKIDNALFKIKNGTFGICEECDGEIETNRLRARPVATECIACKEESERGESQVLYEKRSHTHGKGFGNVIPLRAHAADLETVLASNSDY
ncbi:MAG: TraR/DksA C4-type zinc finger protein [Bacteriovorax sp.]|nr:TraR/DksA C4-type zinc finger protein [Bacteriovorax sp.]